jgi:hypothetical protein|tara:strand:+ start:768 stop:1175 length:408 start_codon:yes stop_codon:yes gene_type:complete
MPTAKQSWLKKYDTYYAQTEYNKKHYGKRIKQLKHMLEDEKFLEFLSSSGHKEDILEYLAKSNHFDMYIAYSEQGEPYIHDHDFGLINHMKKMLGRLQSDGYLGNSTTRPQAKRYVEMYVWYQKEPTDDLPDLPF